MMVHRLVKLRVRVMVGAMMILHIVNVWAQISQVKIENPGVGETKSRMGESVAVDGDTMIAGAPNSTIRGMTYAGLVRIYERDSLGAWRFATELVANDAAAGDSFGNAVALSGDTAFVGAPGDDDKGSSAGAVYVYKRTDGIWNQQAKLTSADAKSGDSFGGVVAISGDTLIVAAGVKLNSVACGAAYVFIRSGEVWTQQAKLIAGDPTAGDNFGCSVSISNDTVIVGSWGIEGGLRLAGSAYIFTREGEVWSQQAKLTAPIVTQDEYFGYSVSISGDAAIVGAWGNDEQGFDYGVAYVFTRQGTAWTMEARLTPGDAARADAFGYCVSIAGDTAIIGTNSNKVGGAAYIFTRSGSAWSQQAKLIADDVTYNQFGYEVMLSGNTAVIGTPYDDDGGQGSGAVYVFTRIGEVWSQQAKMNADDTALYDYFGSSVAVSGETIIIGADQDKTKGIDTGSAYVFVHSNDGWLQQARLTASDAGENDFFGGSAAISGDTAIIGASGDDDRGQESGAAYIFVREGNSWFQQAELTADDAMASDYFGSPVSIDQNTAVISATGDDDAGSNSGSVYIFTREGEIWTQQAKLTAADAVADDIFGCSVSISGETVIIGVRDKDGEYTNSGAAYVFTRVGSTWKQQAKLTAADAGFCDYFGASVSISDDTAIIGASGKDTQVIGGGAAYIFTRSAGIWTQKVKLAPADVARSAEFGNRVLIQKDIAVIGAHLDNALGNYSGSAYLFTQVDGVWGQQAKLTAADGAADEYFGGVIALDKGRIVCGVYAKDDPEQLSGAAYVFDFSHTVNFQTDGTAGATLIGATNQNVNHGADGTAVTAQAPKGWIFVKWSVSGKDYSLNNPLTVTNVAQDMTVTAIFMQKNEADKWMLYE